MTLTVGRASLASTPGGFTKDPVYRLRQSGDELRVTGTLWPSSDVTNTRLAFQQQWTGLADGDIVPVIDTDRYELNGMYAVVGNPTADYVPATTDTAGHLDVSARLVRLPRGFASPALEVVYNSTDSYRPNDQVTGAPLSNEARGWVFQQVTYKELPHSTALALPIANSTTFISPVWRGTDGASGVAPFGLEVPDFYLGAATVLFNGQPAQGKQLYDDPSVVEPERSVVISNDVIRMGIVDTADSNEIYVQAWDGSAWGVVHEYELTVSGAPDLAFAKILPRVLTNRPELVAVEWIMSEDTGGGNTTCTFTAALRRGSRHVEFYVSPISVTGFSLEMDVQWTGGALTFQQMPAIPGVTDYGNNIRRTANDADGNRVVMFSPYQVTTTASTSGLLETEGDANNVTQFALGACPLAQTPNVLAEYFHPISERQVVAW